MRKILTAIFVVGLVATIAGAGTFAYFSDTRSSSENTFTAGTLDLQTMAWNSLVWSDGVTATWTATNMKPGDEFPFNVEFVGLRRAGTLTPSSLEITCDYSVLPEAATEPDGMAQHMIITRFRYNGINYLDDIADVDGDGEKTFYDLKNSPVTGLPIPVGGDSATFFRLSVKFSESAGNEFQGATFDLTMIFTLNQ